jgi:hypothetical protein
LAGVADLEDPTLFIRIAKFDWLVTRRNRVLHAVRDSEWTEAHRADMAADWVVTTPVRLACGQLARSVMIPGMFSRMGLPRCRECCRALGYAEGPGSPKNASGLRKRLGLDGGTAEGPPRRRKFARRSRRRMLANMPASMSPVADIHALAFNAVTQALAEADRFVSLSERESVAAAVEAAIETEIRADERRQVARQVLGYEAECAEHGAVAPGWFDCKFCFYSAAIRKAARVAFGLPYPVPMPEPLEIP